MQGKDPFLALLGLFILGTVFFFCGEGSVTSSPPASKNIESPPSLLSPVSTPVELKKKADELLIGNTMTFRIDSVTLLPGGSPVLSSVAAMLHEDPAVACEAGGHTDDVGPERTNRVLSEHRAKTVIESLISQGIAVERLTPNGHGALRPITENSTDEGHQQNRQIEFSIGTQREQS